jgi:hypothetical protein
MQAEIQDSDEGMEAESLSSVTKNFSETLEPHLGNSAASSQNNNCHHIMCRKKFKD